MLPMSKNTRSPWLVVCIAIAVFQQGPFRSLQESQLFSDESSPPPEKAPEESDLKQRTLQLDSNNEDLHKQLARTQQKVKLLQDEARLLRKQLGETADQLKLMSEQKQQLDQQFKILKTSTQRRGGATIRANSTLQKDLPNIPIQGVQVREDGDVIRMEVPVDMMFQVRTATMQTNAIPIIDHMVDVIMRNYPRQMIGIEGHTDSEPIAGGVWRTQHQLAAAQALAVFEVLATRSQIPSRQMFVLSHGPNHPVVSNATVAGKGRNRRIELVVYPETIK